MFDIEYYPALVKDIITASGSKCYGDDGSRSIRITPFNGAYGVAGYTIAIEGTPPLAVLCLIMQAEHPLIVVSGGWRRPKTRSADAYSGSNLLKSVREQLLIHINNVTRRPLDEGLGAPKQSSLSREVH